MVFRVGNRYPGSKKVRSRFRPPMDAPEVRIKDERQTTRDLWRNRFLNVSEIMTSTARVLKPGSRVAPVNRIVCFL
jgi:hypothetical protein